MKKPNIILCTCDQLVAFALGCYGNSIIQTPNMDRLAARGVRFEIGVSNGPSCVPARSILLAGQYTRTCTGSLFNDAGDPPMPRTRMTDPVLPEVLKGAGYKTALIGKWHVYPDPLEMGFDTAVYPVDAQRQYNQRYRRNVGEPFTVEEFAPEFEVREAINFIKEKKSNPFFLFYNISQPHMPMGPGHTPDKYVDMYKADDMQMRPNVWPDDEIPNREWWMKVYTIWDYFWRTAMHNEPELPSDKLMEGLTLKQLMAWYCGVVTCADDMLGKLMDALEAEGMIDDTLIVFTADHGENMGSHGLFNKDELYEESIRVPMIFHWPTQLQAQENNEQIVSLLDIMPTILGLIDQSIPTPIQGHDMTPVLKGERTALPENYAYIETTKMVGIRSTTHLYGLGFDAATRAVKDSPEFFFNLQNDPYEMQNLAERHADPALVSILRGRLLAWNEATPWLIEENAVKCH